MLSWNFLEKENLSLVCAELRNHQAKVTKLREVTESEILRDYLQIYQTLTETVLNIFLKLC